MSLLRKMLIVDSSTNPLFTSTNRGYVESIQTPSVGLSTADNLVTVTTSGNLIIDSNTTRLTLQLQNNGTQPVIIKISSVPSTTDYNFIMSQASGTRAGDGAVYTTNTLKGAIYGLVETGSGIISILEEVV